MKKKVIGKVVSLVLSLCLVVSVCAVAINTIGGPTALASSSGSLADNVQDGQILQCWNWSFNNIKSNMAKIAEQGFSAVQTSPIQGSKESTKEYYSTMQNSWWVYYQPINFNIETNSYNALGTASEFKAMCDEAEKYGVKVIVDAVLNHTANNNGNNSISTLVPSDLRDDSSCWHDISRNSWYETRWDITQFCMEGIPDLNTGNSKVQNYAINFLKECIDAGADGFRFDGAKHIEVPTDYDYASNFWPNVIGTTTSYAQSTKGFTPYYYGEILDGPSGSSDKANAQTALNSFMSYMSVTQSSVSNSIRNSVNGGSASGAARSDFYFDDGSQAQGKKSVLWNESHDTYIHGGSGSIGTVNMNKTWALVGSRNEAAGMYMARPSSNSDMLGTAGVTGWANTEVKAVNQFKNQFIGQSEYLASSGSIAYIERGTTGAVLVNCGGTSTYANVKANMISDGTYTDAVTGSTFTVSGGYIKGNIGSTGVAVITKDGTTSSGSSSDSSSSTASANIYFDNSAYNWSNVYAYVYSDATSTQNANWPGVKMTLDSATGYYKMSLSGALANGRVIFTESSSASTNRYPADQEPGLEIGGKDMLFSANYSWTEYVPENVQIYFDNSSYNWSTVYAYVYNDSTQNASWPGKKMTYDSSLELYTYTVPGDLADGRVIFTESSSATTNRYPADQEPGLEIGGSPKVFTSGHTWSEYATASTMALSRTVTSSPTDELAAAEPVNVGKYFSAVITNIGANKRITSTDGSNAVIYKSSSSNKQRWIFVRQSDGSYEIKNANYNYCLHVTGASAKDGAKVKIFTDKNNTAQRWFIYKLNGYYVLRAACTTDTVLTVANGGTADKTKVQMNTYDGSDAQLFKISKNLHSKNKNLGDQFTANIYNYNAKKNLSIYDPTNVITYPKSTSDAQKWVFTRQSDGTYEIKNVKYNKLLTVKGNSSATGANIELAKDTNATGQRWQLCYLGYSRYVLRPACAKNMVMFVEDSSKDSGANVETIKYSGKYATCFRIDIIE